MESYPRSILNLTYERAGAVAVLTLDAPPFNIVTLETRRHLAAVFHDLEKQDQVRAVVIQGAGDKAFTSGGDIGAFLDASPDELSHLAADVAAPERSSKPVIARLHGYTFGVGLEIALACDFRVAAEGTLLALPELKLGMIPGSGGTQRVARLAGLGRATDMIMRARRIPAGEAREWGLLTEVVPPSKLDETVWALVDDLLSFSPLALKAAKETLASSLETSLAEGIKLEGRTYGFLRATEDFAEGVRAFKEKRSPHFKGR